MDTWAWVVLLNEKEPRHEEIKGFYKNFRGQKGIVYTTDYILDETFTLLFRRIPYSKARESLEKIDEAIRWGYLRLAWITPERFEKTKELRLRFQDKPGISFTDLSSMVAMQELGLTSVLTEDRHFVEVGFNFRILP